MTTAESTRVCSMERTRAAYVIAGVLWLTLVCGPAILSAQNIEQFDKVFPFIGGWDTGINNPDGQDRGNCGGRLGDYGEKLLNCSMPVDQLPLNKRGEAWLVFADHRASPALSECAEVAVPSLVAGGVYISAYPQHLVFQHPAEAGRLIQREIHMDGRAHPEARHLFQHGHSIGWWDEDDLIVETTNFTFDPDGIDDHLHMASSVRKKVTERYQMIDDDNMRLIITLEDPTFLTRPFKYAYVLSRHSGGPAPAWRECDPEVARNEVVFAYPGNKYPED
jgi:hypothetical protein